MQTVFTLKDKALFYLRYFVLKVFYLWFEVKRPKFKMFVYEMLYSLSKFIDRRKLLPSPFDTDLVETVFGRFRIRPRTVDMSNVSPAFERADVDYLLGLLSDLRGKNKKILFLDIGADIGTYTVTVGNRFKDYAGIHIMAFDPARSSLEVLKESININGLKEKVTTCGFALWSEDDREMEFQFSPDSPGTSSLKASPSPGGKTEKVLTKTLNTVLSGIMEDYDALVFKIDVEGVETEVLRGADKALKSGKDMFIMVEDFVNPVIIDYLEGLGARFVRKLTPYNSWWHYKKVR